MADPSRKVSNITDDDRKRTPSKTLFPDYQSAHSSIVIKSAKNSEIQEAAPASVASGRPPTPIPSFNPFQTQQWRQYARAADPAVDSGSVTDENIAGVRLMNQDSAMQPWQPAHPLQASARLGKSPLHDSTEVDPDQVDTTSEITSEYEDLAGDLPGIDSADVPLPRASSSALPADSPSLIVRPQDHVASVDSEAEDVCQDATSTPANFGLREWTVVQSFGFNDFSGKELKQHKSSKKNKKSFLHSLSGRLENVRDNALSSLRALKDAGSDNLRNIRKSFQGTGSNESQVGFASSSGYKLMSKSSLDFLKQAEVVEGGRSVQVVAHDAQNDNAETHEMHRLDAPSADFHAQGNDTDRSWETVNDDSTTIDLASTTHPLSRPFSSYDAEEDSAESSTWNLQPVSLWGPLRRVNACVNLPAVLKKAQTDQKYLSQATDQVFPSSTKQIKVAESTGVFGGPVTTIQPTTCGQSSSFKFPSPLLPSSFLLPQNVVTKIESGSSSHTSNMSDNLHVDKGKGRANEWGRERSLDMPQSSPGFLADTSRDLEPEFNYEDLFEDIPSSPNDSNADLMISKLPSRVIAFKEPQTSSLAEVCDPEDDQDVSLLLRATKTTPRTIVRTRIPSEGSAGPSRLSKRAAVAISSITTTNMIRHRLMKENVKANISNVRPTRGISHSSRGWGAGGMMGVVSTNGHKIGRAERVVPYEDNLPDKNTFSHVNRLPALTHNRTTEMMLRERISIANDEWNRLKHECPQFPLRDDHLLGAHPVKLGQKKCRRLERLENGAWLEQAYCSHHGRDEFSAVKGMAVRPVKRTMVKDQHRAGKLAVLCGCVLFPVGGFIVLKHLEEDRGLAVDFVRLFAAGAGVGAPIEQPHEDERRLAGLMFEVMTFVWVLVGLAALCTCIWAVMSQM